MCSWSLRHCSLESCQKLTLCSGGKKQPGSRARPQSFSSLWWKIQTYLRHLASCKKHNHEFGKELSLRESLWGCGRCKCSACPSVLLLSLSLLSLLQLQPGCVAVLLLLPEAPAVLGHSPVAGSSPCLRAVLCVFVCVSLCLCITDLRFSQEFARSTNALNSSIEPQ